MKRQTKQIAGTVVLLTILAQGAGCATPEQSRLTGQVVGTAVGIAVGSQFGEGLGTAFAVAHGAWLGFQFGELIGRQDPKAESPSR